MNLKCKLGIHTWQNCKCTQCGKNRDSNHSWNDGCTCTQCGKIRDRGHSWDDCICKKCGRNRVEYEIQNGIGDNIDYHKWKRDCEKCSKCGVTRIKPHHLEYNCEKCYYCDKTFLNNHEWDGCICKKCGKTRHDIGRICSKCGKELNEGTFIDDRDGRTYRWILIGDQILMNEGLKYKTNSDCWAFNNNEEWRGSDGYLYDWETANKVAPIGWHLPSKEEWEKLCDLFGKSDEPELIYSNLKKSFIYFNTVGRREGNGRFCEDSGRFWSSTRIDDEHVYTFGMSDRGSRAGILPEESNCAFNIRLFRDF